MPQSCHYVSSLRVSKCHVQCVHACDNLCVYMQCAHVMHVYVCGVSCMCVRLTCSLVVLPRQTSPMWNPASPTTGMNTHTPTNNRINLCRSQGNHTLSNTQCHNSPECNNIYIPSPLVTLATLTHIPDPISNIINLSPRCKSYYV